MILKHDIALYISSQEKKISKKGGDSGIEPSCFGEKKVLISPFRGRI